MGEVRKLHNCYWASDGQNPIVQLEDPLGPGYQTGLSFHNGLCSQLSCWCWKAWWNDTYPFFCSDTSSQPKLINQILLFLSSTSSVLNVHAEYSAINSDPSLCPYSSREHKGTIIYKLTRGRWEKRMFSFAPSSFLSWLCVILQVFTCLMVDSFCGSSVLFYSALLNS